MPIRKLISHHLIFLIILCLGIGIYKITVLACVSNDSVTFMRFAEDLKIAPGQAIQSCDQHPGYPAILLASQWVLGKLGDAQALGQRIVAAQAATLICRVIAVCFLYSIFRFFGNKKTSLVSTILVILIPAYANNGSEVLSDWPNLMLMAMALFFCLRGLRKPSILIFVSAGVFSGLAYWVRPEGAVFVVIMGIYTLIHLLGKKTGKLKLCLCCGVMIISAVLIAGPYMVYKGALFPKKKVGTFSASSKTSDMTAKYTQYPSLRADIAGTAGAVKPAKAIWHFIDKLLSVLYLLSVPLFGMMIYKMQRFGRLRGQDQLLILFISLWLGLMVWLHCRTGYMSYRHIMPLVIFGFAWVLRGLHGLVLMTGSKRCNLHRDTAVVIGICIAIFAPKLIRPAHADKAIYKQTGLWLRDNTPAESTLAVFDNRIGFYAERPCHPLNRTASLGQGYLIIKATDESTALPEKAALITTGKADIDKVIRIYRLRP